MASLTIMTANKNAKKLDENAKNAKKINYITYLHYILTLHGVKKSQAKKSEALGIIGYNKINADTEQKHRDKLKSTIGMDEYKKTTSGIYEAISQETKGTETKTRRGS